MRLAVMAALLLVTCTLGNAPQEAPGCVRDADCPRTYACRGGACLRYSLPPGTPYDPRDGGTTDVPTDLPTDLPADLPGE